MSKLNMEFVAVDNDAYRSRIDQSFAIMYRSEKKRKLILNKIILMREDIKPIKAMMEKDKYSSRKIIDSTDLINSFCVINKCPYAILSSRARRHDLVIKRHILSWFLRKSNGMEYKDIGFVTGGRGHCASLFSVRQISDAIDVKDKEVLAIIKTTAQFLIDVGVIYSDEPYLTSGYMTNTSKKVKLK